MKVILSTTLLIGLSIALLTGCGFKPRGQYLLSPKLQTLTITSVDKFGELTRLVKQHFIANEVNLVNSSAEPVPELHILQDKLRRRMLSVFPNGQVAEYEIIYTVKYQLHLADEDIRDFEFELYRDYQDDPNFALAKSREANLLLSEMRQLAADRILRTLASIQP